MCAGSGFGLGTVAFCNLAKSLSNLTRCTSAESGIDTGTDVEVGAGTIGGAGVGIETIGTGVEGLEVGRRRMADAIVDERVLKNWSKNS
jgi:hypothetical protein